MTSDIISDRPYQPTPVHSQLTKDAEVMSMSHDLWVCSIPPNCTLCRPIPYIFPAV